jgi:hypothetical protein
MGCTEVTRMGVERVPSLIKSRVRTRETTLSFMIQQLCYGNTNTCDENEAVLVGANGL